jgi:allantoin racemase
MRIKVIEPVSPPTPWNREIKEMYEAYKDPGTEIEVVNPEKGPESIEQTYDETWTGLPTLLEAEKAEQEGYDAVIDYCFGDPALTSLKEALSIPVVGINEPSVHLASILGRRLSVIGVGGKNEQGMINDKIASYGLGGRLASVRLTDIRVLDIKKDFDHLVSALTNEGKRAVEEDGADVLVLGCGGLLNVAEILQKKLEVPVIDPGLVALKIAEDLVKLKLVQSKKAFGEPYGRKKRS